MATLISAADSKVSIQYLNFDSSGQTLSKFLEKFKCKKNVKWKL